MLGSWEVEEEVCFDEGFAGFVVEDELFVAVREDILGLEFVVKFLRDLVASFLVGFAEEVVLLAWKLEVALLVAKVRQSLWSYNGGFRVCLEGKCQHLLISLVHQPCLPCASSRGRCDAPDPARRCI